MHHLIQEFIQDECGSSIIEYGLIASTIALALVAILSSLGGIVTEAFDSVSNSMGSAGGDGNGGSGDACNTAPTAMGPALTLVAMLAALRRRR